MKKILSILFAAALLAPLANVENPSTAFADEQTSFGGYYEVAEGKGVFALPAPLDGEITALSVDGLSLDLTSADGVLTENSLTVTLPTLSTLALGGEYTLRVETATQSVGLDFLYVTKAISSAEDCLVFDLATSSTIVTGYYALTRDLDIGETLATAHQGPESLPTDKCGFAGTFNGQGHNITFVAGKYGFFGNILPNAVVENVGFVDVTYYKGIADKRPILAYSCYITRAQNKAQVRNCFFMVGDLPVGGGALLYDGLTSSNLFTQNVVIKYGNLTTRTHSTGIGVGAYIGWDRDWGKSERDGGIENVYVVSGFGLGSYNHEPYNPDGGVYGENLWTDFNSYKNGWVDTYASNEGVVENFSQGKKVYANLKSYVTYAEMAADQNDYSSFDGRYWDCNYGVPLWKSSLDAACEIAVVTKASVSSEHFTLRLGKVETAQFVFGPFGAPMAGVKLSYELYDGDGFDKSVVSVADDLTITAIKVGKAKIKVSCTYQGTYYEKIMRITVKEAVNVSDSSSEETGEKEPTPQGGCAGSLGGVGFSFALASVLAVAYRRKRK